MVHLIIGLKCDFGGRHFTIDEDPQNAVAEFFAKQGAEWYSTVIPKLILQFFAKQDTEWYSTVIPKLILHYNNCLDEQGDYVET